MPLTAHREPRVSPELQTLRSLSPRLDLSAKHKKNLSNLEKGYQGEWNFFQLLVKKLTSNCIRLYDLLLECNQTEFQIDNLLIFQNTIFMNEVKNFAGDFYVKDDQWYAVAKGKEIRNPLPQLQRSEFLLRQLLQQLGVHFQLEAQLVFVHPEFTLYQAPYDKSLVFPTQLKRYLKKLNTVPSSLTTKHRKFAEQLVALNLEKSSQERLPEFHYDQLQKGIVCSSCKHFMAPFNNDSLQCTNCRTKEKLDDAVMRSTEEFHVLFPKHRITTTEIFEWCKVVNSKKTIRRILMKNMTLNSNGKYSYYTKKQ